MPETKQGARDFLLACLLVPLEDRINHQRQEMMAIGGVHPNLDSYPAVRERFVSTFERMRQNALALMHEGKYEEAERAINEMWPQLCAIANEVHPDGCLETDGAAQWLTPFLHPFPHELEE